MPMVHACVFVASFVCPSSRSRSRSMTENRVPFAGRMSYCLTKSLKMVLEAKGDNYPIAFLECVGTEPFAFVYVRARTGGGFAVNGLEYDQAGERMLTLLGYDYEISANEPSERALARLKTWLADGPVVAGMLDMGYLTYQPDYREKRGADHAIVVLAVEDDHVIVHDPDGYVCTPLPIADFLNAWKAEGLYTGKAYALWRVGARRRIP